MEKRIRTSDVHLAESPSQRQKLNHHPAEDGATTTSDSKLNNAELSTLNSANIDLLNTFLSPSRKNDDDLVLRSTSSQSTVSQSSEPEIGEDITTTSASDITTKNKGTVPQRNIETSKKSRHNFYLV